ncbi:hypothetical protein [Thetidibacter halocola]|uniref:Uncharacterized protein n=1 Tax=Thetidibacter halocola TaxID=2827239 RepID=A0A8J7WDA2_9RHOB|nr:hypothetical protein [Thetidibacter halocola]MBS0123576.1 hypothetical protein [Thetidibacter halocola]
MSAPDTNLDKQTRRHRPALAGIALAVAVAGLMLAGYLIILAERGNTPGEEPAITAPATN